MRAIPFEAVCLLGMNDGDFPRSQPPLGFDLMAGPAGYRPGDRSRRDDDRYLFLEALLSARRHLYLSWVGRRVQDNAEKPPSLLVAQLRDYLAAGWQVADPAPGVDGGRALLDRLTLEHPLQAFSRRYFLPAEAEGHDARLFSYAREWRAAHEAGETAAAALALDAFEPAAPLNLDALAGFLRHPVKTFFTERLKVRFDRDDGATRDAEPFGCDRLEGYVLGSELLAAALAGPVDAARERFEAMAARQRRRGDLPLGGFADLAQTGYARPAWDAYRRAVAVFECWPEAAAQPREIRYEAVLADGSRAVVEDWLPGLRGDGQGRWALIDIRPQTLADPDGVAKWHNLVGLWARHLAACAMGLDLTAIQVGSDRGWMLPPLPEDRARAWLDEVLAARRQGLRQPLPLPCRTGFAWVSEGSDPDRAAALARTVYEGGFNRLGERDRDPYLARAFPCFDDLWGRTDDLAHWARHLYGPLLDTLCDAPEAAP
jgi:exodeoxyribonuclease V gamma subunit